MKYVLFGAGALGRKVYNLLKYEYNIVCFADNDSMKQTQKYLSIDIINPNQILELGLTPIIAVNEIYRMTIINQLYDINVKKFYIINDDDITKLNYIDLIPYGNIEENKNKICILRRKSSASIAKCFKLYNPFNDLIIEEVNVKKIDSESFYAYKSSSLIITQFLEDTGSKKSIELWHGFFIKPIGLLNPNGDRLNYHSRAITKNSICSLSKLYSIFIGYCLNVPYNKLSVTGYPRNDMLITADGKKNLEILFGRIEQKYILIYMPTFREHVRFNSKKARKNENEFIFDMPNFNIDDFNEFLIENDILFISKMHPVQINHETFKETDNIKVLTDNMLDEVNMDLYEIINGTDCLISDYSSIITDYLLVDKPIILTPLDIEAYIKRWGLMMEPYDAWMPGEIVIDFEPLKEAILNSLFNHDKYKIDREKLRKITHFYTDAKSTERVLTLARKILDLDGNN